MKESSPESDLVLFQTITSVVGKSIAFICLTIVAGMLFSTCKVSAAAIEECESACSKTGILEVTSTSCECMPPEPISPSPFVLPSTRR